MGPAMPPERIAALLVSVVPVLTVIASVIIAIAARAPRKHDDPTPTVGVAIEDDDHADDAIQALRDQVADLKADRDEWKQRALGAEKEKP